MVSKGSTDLHSQLYNLGAYEFEKFVADLWAAHSWETERTTDSQDHGVDVFASKEDTIQHKIAIQAKRYGPNKTVGEPEIREYLGVKYQDPSIDAVVIVTTAEFTRDAEDWADENSVQLVDGDDLIEMIDEVEESESISQYISARNSNPEEADSFIETEQDEQFASGDGVSSDVQSDETEQHERPDYYRGFVGQVRMFSDLFRVFYYKYIFGVKSEDMDQYLPNR